MNASSLTDRLRRDGTTYDVARRLVVAPAVARTRDEARNLPATRDRKGTAAAGSTARVPEIAYSPPQSDAGMSGDGFSCVNWIRSWDDSTTVMPSGNCRCMPRVTGDCGLPAASNWTMETLPQRGLKVTGSRFSSA